MSKSKQHSEFVKYSKEDIDSMPNLSLEEQVAYKRIAAYTQLNGAYDKPLTDLAYWLRSSKDTARRVIKSLTKMGLLEVVTAEGKPTAYKAIPWVNISEVIEEAKRRYDERQPIANCNPSQIATPCKMQPHPSQIATPVPPIDIYRYNMDVNTAPAREEEKKKKPAAKFQKPTVEDIAAYCAERGNNINAEEFFNFYESKGWLIGKNPMKDWRAAVSTWEQRHKNEQQNTYNNGTRNYQPHTGTTADQQQAKPYQRIQDLANTRFHLE